MKNKILLIGNKQDIHADSIVASFQNRDKEIIRLNAEDFRTNEIQIDLENGLVLIKTQENRIINSEEIQSVYVRRISPFNCEDIESDYKKFVISETKEVLNALEFLFANSKWMDKFSIRDSASNKINQLLLAKKCGLLIPETLITNSPQIFSKFSKCRRIVYKTLYIPAIDFENKGTGIINTTLLEKGHLEYINETLPVAPSLFQCCMNKKYELRIHIIGNRIIAIKINSQKINEAKIDWQNIHEGTKTWWKWTEDRDA